MKKVLIMVVLLLGLIQLCQAEDPDNKAWEPLRIRYLLSRDLKEIKPSADIAQLVSFQFEGEKYYRGKEVDLNNDGVDDYVFVSPPILCGTGGCLWMMIDGASKEVIGQFFGNPVFMFENQINGFPVIHTYSHSSAQSGSYNGYVFDGTSYAHVSQVFLEGESVEELFEPYSNWMGWWQVERQPEGDFLNALRLPVNESEKVIEPQPTDKALLNKRIADLGKIVRIVVPYQLPSRVNSPDDISKEKIQKMLTEFYIVDFDDFNSRTHIPLGSQLRVEFLDGSSLSVMVFHGVPFTGSYHTKDGKVFRFGMEESKREGR